MDYQISGNLGHSFWSLSDINSDIEKWKTRECWKWRERCWVVDRDSESNKSSLRKKCIFWNQNKEIICIREKKVVLSWRISMKLGNTFSSQSYYHYKCSNWKKTNRSITDIRKRKLFSQFCNTFSIVMIRSYHWMAIRLLTKNMVGDMM